jgi:hypothetical protein
LFGVYSLCFVSRHVRRLFRFLAFQDDLHVLVIWLCRVKFLISFGPMTGNALFVCLGRVELWSACARSSWTFVTSRACREIITAKRSLPVVTTRTTKRTRPRVVIERLWRRHISRLRTRAYAMTIVATETFVPIVLFVTEADSISRCVIRRAREASELVTSAARRDVATIHLRSWRVTTETSDVSIEARGNRKTLATPVGPVTRRASGADTSVCCVIESDVETLQRRK